MKFIPPLVLLTMRHNVQIQAMHVEGAKHNIADSLSRFQINRVRHLAPSADLYSGPIPQEFLTIILDL